MSAPNRVPDDGVRQRQQQIAANLRALILSGDLRAGDKVPSTADLMTQYGVTDKTVQRALAILKAERFVEGQKGRGVFVTAHTPTVIQASHYPQPARDQPYRWITDNASRGRAGSIELLHVGEVPAPAQVAAAFGLEAGTPVVVRQQLLSLDGQPAELVWSYYTTEVARGTRLAENRKIRGGTPAVLAELGFPLRNAVDQVLARLATVDEFIALRLPEDMPVLRQLRVVFTEEQRPIEVTVMVKAGQHYEIQYELPSAT
ncbi:GntR family transcriptional regulator [Pseudosporangium ferrugineum]|uniref:GntR family transcriptional regulator n=1 Tax=Pseudosporangium ferrugineum TaxID=439699 RepID=A0A2T0RSH5_9ACTN|nr:GntR family transcriptional regulator [Pseudosporangium ferrugineum]PRY24043.1 GntR family transcriptional regulator [Pseudosporangium ferrugineum]